MSTGDSIAPPSASLRYAPWVTFTYSALRNIVYYGFVPGVLVLGTRTAGAPSLRDLPMKIIIL